MNSYDKRIKLYIFLLSLPLVAGLIFVGVFFKMKLDKLYDPTDLAPRQGILHQTVRKCHSALDAVSRNLKIQFKYWIPHSTRGGQASAE